MNEDKRIELLMGHYDKTFEQIVSHWKSRNRLFMYVLVLMTLLAIDWAQPGSLARIVNDWISKTTAAQTAATSPAAVPAQPATAGAGPGASAALPDATAGRATATATSPAGARSQPSAAGKGAEAAGAFSFAAVGTLSWFVLLCLVVQYYQRSIHVDRQYNYIGDLEETLCTMMGGGYITREGRAYFTAKGVYKADEKSGGKHKRPHYLRAVGPLYTLVFPMVLTFFVIFGLVRGGWRPGNVAFWLNLAFGAAIIFYNGSYLRWVRAKR